MNVEESEKPKFYIGPVCDNASARNPVCMEKMNLPTSPGPPFNKEIFYEASMSEEDYTLTVCGSV